MTKYTRIHFLTGTLLLTSWMVYADETKASEVELQQLVSLDEAALTPILDYFISTEKTCAWIPEYTIVTDLINRMNLQVGCEIGVAYGLQSKYFLEHAPLLKKLYSVDPYRHFDTGYIDVMNMSQVHFDILHYRVTKRLSPFGERSVLLRETSEQAAKRFEDESLDFVYIDANHSYEAVQQDIAAWAPKVRYGGLIAGDDFNDCFPGVMRAAREFAARNGFKLCRQGIKWWVVKS